MRNFLGVVWVANLPTFALPAAVVVDEIESSTIASQAPSLSAQAALVLLASH